MSTHILIVFEKLANGHLQFFFPNIHRYSCPFKCPNNIHYHLTGESKQERLCLSVLNNLDLIPDIGFKLIPEHVETRSLYRSDRPGVEQVIFII